MTSRSAKFSQAPRGAGRIGSTSASRLAAANDRERIAARTSRIGAAPPRRGELLRPGPGVSPPRAVEIPFFSYPTVARGSGLKPKVRVAVLVDEHGRVLRASPNRGDGVSSEFRRVAVATARKARFRPASRGGVPGKMWAEIVLQFAE